MTSKTLVFIRVNKELSSKHQNKLKNLLAYEMSHNFSKYELEMLHSELHLTDKKQ
ncbi:hypothetical protein GCM10022395_08990 [Snuella lapsa]|uniref:Fur-regulated basic protein FbpA n=1 Tax=Snuella lapsa TaxID=870481 RepID=A0ABP6X3G7_9FLAO